MSQELINRSPDLKRLQDEGYEVEIKAGYLLLKSVPYVNINGKVERGTLVSNLTLANDKTTTPNPHIAYFIGKQPCHKDGSEIAQIKHTVEQKELDKDLIVHRSFSNKPSDGYRDYYEKMTQYATIISSPAEALEPNATAKTFHPIKSADEESPFHYLDTASSRAEITSVTRKLELPRVAIVGIGGTGSYVLDLVTKTPAKEIHIFDNDKFLQHNAFRSPGAPSLEELEKTLYKVDYFKGIYSQMHKGIIAHRCYVDASNVDQLHDMSFVFICLDKGAVKKRIIENLEKFEVPFIDVGMGVELVDGSLLGILRTTTSTTAKRDHVIGKHRISLADDAGNDEYSRNIQIADLNALNAALAVVKWKKLFGFYHDLEKEHHSTYTTSGNMLRNEDQE